MTIEKRLSHAIKSKNLRQVELVFEQIYYEYGKLVGYIISKYVLCKEDIEELVNDVFVNFSKVLYDIRLDNIKYYLVTQAKNISIDYLRKAKRKNNVIYEEECVLSSVDQNNTAYYELIEELKRYLKEDEINIIILHSVYDYSFVEIAKKQNKPITTIKSIYHRALKKYKKRRAVNGTKSN